MGPPAPDLTPLRAAGIPTVDDATFAARLEDLSEHRRRLTSFAREALFDPAALDPNG